MGPVTTLPLEKTAQIDLRQAARYFGEPGEPDGATLAQIRAAAAAAGQSVNAWIIEAIRDKL